MQATKAKEEIVKGEKDSAKIVDGLTEVEKLMPELRTLSYCLNKIPNEGIKKTSKQQGTD